MLEVGFRRRSSSILLRFSTDFRVWPSPVCRNHHFGFIADFRVWPSPAWGHFFLGSLPQDGCPIKLNGAILTQSTILKCVAASAAEAKLGALFINAMDAKVMRLTLEAMGHPQPPTPIHVDNSTAVGIVNNTIKRQRSRAMNMRYFWLLCQEAQRILNVRYHPGHENLGDFPSKNHNGAQCHHVQSGHLSVEGVLGNSEIPT
ncbi:hypothetical protein ACHAXR_000868 [Thalassiosira sp. AJA248-18]